MKVIELHGGMKPHLGTLADRILDVIEEFTQDAIEKDLPITYAEIIGTLYVIQTQFTMMSFEAGQE
jgi:hypothetical protein